MILPNRFTGDLLDPYERRRILAWEAIVGTVAGGIGDALQAVGIGADTAGTIAQVATPALIGAGGGALAGAIGGSPGIGALTGGALGALYGGYNAAGGASGIGQMLGLSGGATPVPGGSAAVPATSYSSMSPDQQVAADVAAEDAGGGMTPAQSASVKGALSSMAAPVDSRKGISQTNLALGALAALGSALSKQSNQNQPFNATSLPGPSSTAATQGPVFNAPMNPTGYINRTATTPTLPGTGYQMQGATPQSYANSYFNYGPEPNFFNNNNVNLGKPFARGGAAHEPLFDSGGSSGAVDGPGDGQSDSVPARLQDGSFVWNADVVNAFGSGSSDAGKRRLAEAERALGGKGAGMAQGGHAGGINARVSKDEVVWSPQVVSAAGKGSNDKGAKVLDKVRRAVMSDRGIKAIVPKPVTKSPLQYLARAS